MADLPLATDEMRRQLALSADRQYGIDPGADNERGYAFNQWMPFSTNRVGSPSWVQQGNNPQWAVPQALQGGLLGVAGMADAPRTGKLTPEALGSLLTGSTLAGGLLAPEGSLAAGGAIKAYHGSPHDFDKFSFENIGTGEGAAAYGHGLYFAESPGVAQTYRDMLAGEPEIQRLKLGNMVVGPHNNFDYSRNAGRSTLDNIHSTLAEDLLINQSDLVGAPDKQAFALAKLDDLIKRYRTEWPEAVPDAMALRERLARPGAVSLKMGPQPGKTYEVNIHADPNKFLDWDKPLSQQHPQVQQAFTGKLVPSAGDVPGSALYTSLSGAYDKPALSSEYLANRDIPGVRYLDQMSRDRGKGTSNYVVFPTQDEIIEILRKYGLAAPSPAVPAAQGPAPTPGLLSDRQSEVPMQGRVY